MIFIYSFYSRKEKFYSKGKSTSRSGSGPEPEKCGSEGQQRPTLIRRSKQPFLSSELQQKVCWTEGQPEGNAELFGAVTAFSSCLFRKHSLHVYLENTGPDLVLSALGNVTWWLSSRGRLSSGAGADILTTTPVSTHRNRDSPREDRYSRKISSVTSVLPTSTTESGGPSNVPP